MKQKPRHVFQIKFNMTRFLVIVEKMAPSVAIAKATSLAARDLTDPHFEYCEYLGQEDV